MQVMRFLSLFVFFLLAAGTSFALGETSEEASGGWPRMFESEGRRVVVHQPQLDEWEDYALLRGKAAVAVTLKDGEDPYYGAVYFQADTESNLDTGMVLLKNLEYMKFVFPNIEESLATRCERAVIEALPQDEELFISMDRLIADLERTKEQSEGVAVNLDPPPIFRAEQPAILVMFMGEPQFEPVQGASKLLYAVNTNWDILLELGSSRYYMLYEESWLVTSDVLKGPWEAAKALPKSFRNLPDDDDWKEVKEQIPGKPAPYVPLVFSTTQPSELITTDGAPSFTPIPDTKLLYVTNTESDLFLAVDEGQYYFLTAGRWFRAVDLDGPWEAASTDLPDDFLEIPSDHEKADVLASVPGTLDADAAVLLATIPQKASVNRRDTTVEVVYEGDPTFVEIEGTTSLVYYAVNTPYSVFRVKKSYYCAHDGVWFVAGSAMGPWIVSPGVPQALYTIPSRHPKHNVTYVYVYDSTPDVVVVGYTSGYYGSYIVPSGVLMFGFGFWRGFDDVFHHHYRHRHYHYHPYYYSYGCAARYNYYHGGYYRSARYYGPFGGLGGAAGYNPRTRAYYRGGYAHGPFGRAFALQAYNPYTRRHAARARARTAYGSWDRGVVPSGGNWVRAENRLPRGKLASVFKFSKRASAVARSDRKKGRGAVVGKDKHGDLYVGNNGSVFKRGDDGWKKRAKKGWKPVENPKVRSKAKAIKSIDKPAARRKAEVKRPEAKRPEAKERRQAREERKAKRFRAAEPAKKRDGARDRSRRRNGGIDDLNRNQRARERGDRRARRRSDWQSNQGERRGSRSGGGRRR